MVEALFSLLLGYHSLKVGSSYTLEAEESRHARLRTISEKVVAVCRDRPLWFLHGKKRVEWPEVGCVAATATVVKWESGFLKEIHEGSLLGKAGERCLAQPHRTVVNIPDSRWAITRDEWASTTGLDAEATERCIRVAVKILGWHVYRCRIAFNGGRRMPAARLYQEYHYPSGFPCAKYRDSGALLLPPGSVAHGVLSRPAPTSTVMRSLSPMSMRRAESYQQLLWKLTQKAGEP